MIKEIKNKNLILLNFENYIQNNFYESKFLTNKMKKCSRCNSILQKIELKSLDNYLIVIKYFCVVCGINNINIGFENIIKHTYIIKDNRVYFNIESKNNEIIYIYILF